MRFLKVRLPVQARTRSPQQFASVCDPVNKLAGVYSVAAPDACLVLEPGTLPRLDFSVVATEPLTPFKLTVDLRRRLNMLFSSRRPLIGHRGPAILAGVVVSGVGESKYAPGPTSLFRLRLLVLTWSQSLYRAGDNNPRNAPRRHVCAATRTNNGRIGALCRDRERRTELECAP